MLRICKKTIISGILLVWSTLEGYSVDELKFPLADSWNDIISTSIPPGRKQLEIYKRIYSDYASQNNQEQEKIKEDTDKTYEKSDGLKLPFSWLYAHAYRRFCILENTECELKNNWELKPTEALKKLFVLHVKDQDKKLSPISFLNCVYDVVYLMDFYFHPNEDNYLRKTNLDDIFNKMDNQTILPENFSPVFLQKCGLSISSLNYGYFGDGSFLSVGEIGPIRNAHGRLFSQTHYWFLARHDLVHASDTKTFLKNGLPEIFTAFQTFYQKIETQKEGQDILHLGLFLLGHEYTVNCFKGFSYQNQSLKSLEDMFHTKLQDIILVALKTSFLESVSDYVVLYQDVLMCMASIVQKYGSCKNQTVCQNTYDELTAQNYKNNSTYITRLIDNFYNLFTKVATPVFKEIDMEQTKNKHAFV